MLLSISYEYNPFLGRFALLPVVLVAPLLAGVYRFAPVVPALVVVACVSLAAALGENELQPARLGADAAWRLPRTVSVGLAGGTGLEAATRAVDTLVPASGRVGAALGGNDPSYPFFGRMLERRVRYLSGPDTLGRAAEEGLRVVVVGPGATPPAQPAPGWRVRRLPGRWLVAIRAPGSP